MNDENKDKLNSTQNELVSDIEQSNLENSTTNTQDTSNNKNNNVKNDIDITTANSPTEEIVNSNISSFINGTDDDVSSDNDNNNDDTNGSTESSFADLFNSGLNTNSSNDNLLSLSNNPKQSTIEDQKDIVDNTTSDISTDLNGNSDTDNDEYVFDKEELEHTEKEEEQEEIPNHQDTTNNTDTNHQDISDDEPTIQNSNTEDDIKLTNKHKSRFQALREDDRRFKGLLFLIIGSIISIIIFTIVISQLDFGTPQVQESKLLKDTKDNAKQSNDYALDLIHNAKNDIRDDNIVPYPPQITTPTELPKPQPTTQPTVNDLVTSNKYDDNNLLPTPPTPPKPTISKQQIYKQKFIALRGSTGIKLIQVKNNNANATSAKSDVVTLSNAIPKNNDSNTNNQDQFLGTATVIKDNIDPNYLLSMDTPIRCSLNQRIINTYRGNISCTIMNDVYSINGNRILIPKGSKAIGIYGAINVPQGDDKLIIGFNQIRTPSLTYINIQGNEGGNNLGVRGITGSVDNRFFARLGQYLMLSMVSDVGSYIGYKLRGSTPEEVITDNSTTRAPDFTKATRSTIEQFIKQSLQANLTKYQPTVTINQGTEISILLNKDVNFSNILH